MKTLMQHADALRDAPSVEARTAIFHEMNADLRKLNTDDLWAILRSTRVDSEAGAYVVASVKDRLGLRA